MASDPVMDNVAEALKSEKFELILQPDQGARSGVDDRFRGGVASIQTGPISEIGPVESRINRRKFASKDADIGKSWTSKLMTHKFIRSVGNLATGNG